MNNEINESNKIKIIKEKENNENHNNNFFHKINIIKAKEINDGSKTPFNNNINKLFLTPTLKERHTKSPLKEKIIDGSLFSKKSKYNQLEIKENLIVSLLKTKTFKEKTKNKNKIKRKNICKSGKDTITFGNPLLKRRASINYNFKIDPNNIRKNGSMANVLKYTNSLYEADDHLKKGILTKKIDMNNFSNTKRNNELFMSGRINNLFQKKKLIISFGLKDQNDNLIQNKGNFNRIQTFKGKISSISRVRTSNEFRERDTFSNYLQITQRLKTPNKEKGDQTNKNYHKIDDIITINNNNTNKIYKINKDGDITSKSNKFYLSRAKTYKTKNNCNKILEESNNDFVKIKQKNNLKTSKNKSKKKESINKNKNSNNIFDINKRENPKKEQEDSNKKKKKFCFTCCFNSKDSDSDGQ